MSASLPRPLARAAAASVALVLSLSLAACGGDEPEKGPEETTGPQKTSDGHELDGMWPLTGLPAKGAAPKRPVVVVKIDNTSSARPQVGLGSADLVTEELVEGGITRLAVAYYSKVPRLVGPVRSMRASDIGIVRPTKGVLVASGAAAQTKARLNKDRIKYFEGGDHYFREGSRRAPYNLMVNLADLARGLKAPASPPPNYLPFEAESKWNGVTKARQISVRMSRAHTTNWAYRGGKYINVNSYAPASDQFKADTVLVLRVQVGDAGYRDPAGYPVPETIYKGKGQALVFHQGELVRGTWSKARLDSQLQLSTKSGKLNIPAGKTWIELVPVASKGGNVTFRK